MNTPDNSSNGSLRMIYVQLADQDIKPWRTYYLDCVAISSMKNRIFHSSVIAWSWAKQDKYM